jgi:Icc-related predicted phosphoesterase
MVKTIVTSDLHGNLPVIVEDFDLMLICGDIVPVHDHYYSFQKEWVENEFIEWIIMVFNICIFGLLYNIICNNK